MKAVVLVGGYGTRLRPLTISLPKPLVEFANQPVVVHQIEALKAAGCTEIILAIAYKKEVMVSFVREWEERLGVRIVLSEEPYHLGTAGPLALARDLIQTEAGDPFFLLNGDVICTFPLRELLQFHRSRKAEVSLLVKEVQDPKRFGAVVTEKSGRVECFVEKPASFLSAKINAGIYVIDVTVLDRIDVKPTSLEKEVLPAVAARNKLFALPLDGYWTDLGEPDDYMKGMKMHLEHLCIKARSTLAQGDAFEGNVLLGERVQIGERCQIGPNVCIGADCVIGRGVRLMNCAVMSGTTIGDFVYCVDSLIGWRCTIGDWCRLENGCTLGEHVRCKEELMFNGATVLPHKSLSESVMQPDVIL